LAALSFLPTGRQGLLSLGIKENDKQKKCGKREISIYRKGFNLHSHGSGLQLGAQSLQLLPSYIFISFPDEIIFPSLFNT
jgi:hypothetical protein